MGLLIYGALDLMYLKGCNYVDGNICPIGLFCTAVLYDCSESISNLITSQYLTASWVVICYSIHLHNNGCGFYDKSPLLIEVIMIHCI